MPNANGQHTDAENSRASQTATNAGDALTQVSSRSVREISQDRTEDAGKGETVEIPVPFPAGNI